MGLAIITSSLHPEASVRHRDLLLLEGVVLLGAPGLAVDAGLLGLTDLLEADSLGLHPRRPDVVDDDHEVTGALQEERGRILVEEHPRVASQHLGGHGLSAVLSPSSAVLVSPCKSLLFL